MFCSFKNIDSNFICVNQLYNQASNKCPGVHFQQLFNCLYDAMYISWRDITHWKNTVRLWLIICVMVELENLRGHLTHVNHYILYVIKLKLKDISDFCFL